MDFLALHIRRNPKLIQIAAEFHQLGLIKANTTVIDLDTLTDNARLMKKEADRLGLENYFMTKQFGRNPLVCRAIMKAGFKSAVAVDMEDARCLHRNDIPVGHVGHLVQVPKHEIGYILREVKPEIITVFSIAKAQEIDQEARRLGVTQKILVRVVGQGDFFYPFQEGGILESDISETTRTLANLKNVHVVGLTSFPCFRFNIQSRKDEPTPNLSTLQRVASRLRNEFNLNIEQINTPGDTSTTLFQTLADMGATHGEPGHGFTGTTPGHAFDDLPELPAWVYVSEVSHIFGSKAYAYGGGLMGADAPLGFWTPMYHRHYMYALVGDDPDTILHQQILAEPAGFIDYYGSLVLGQGDKVAVGNTVIYGFRNQVFASRANIAVIEGIHNGVPRLSGAYDRMGNLLP
ncbi:MAG TPA: alanine racemase [Atribacteraceae bacterium]|nr:alanine racemase [Atribacteraceae bacterium]